MSGRHRLPNRRSAETFTVDAFGLKFAATVGPDPSDDRVMEIFLSNHKPGGAAGIVASDAAVAASLALQFGCPSTYCAKPLMRDGKGRASGPLGQALDQIVPPEAHVPCCSRRRGGYAAQP
jgi:ribonucleoside-diphosphate reductase alpha chain